MTKQKLSRSAALAGGWSKYFTGEPCKNGHIAERWTLSAACAECQEERRTAQAEQFKQARAAREE